MMGGSNLLDRNDGSGVTGKGGGPRIEMEGTGGGGGDRRSGALWPEQKAWALTSWRPEAGRSKMGRHGPRSEAQ